MPLRYQLIRDRGPDRITQKYTRTDCIVYALGVGAGQEDPTDTQELPFVYEQGLRTLPTMATVLAAEPFWMQEAQWGIDWRKVVHAEQTLVLHRPLPPEGEVTGVTRVEEIYDKGAGHGALMYLKRELFDSSGILIAEVGKAAFLRGEGGFGGPCNSAPVAQPVPLGRLADLTLSLRTRPEQALIYRLSGDRNPLHIDPQVAASAGFSRPILHGLCTYAVAGRALHRMLCAGDAQCVRRLDARFVSPVFPGETILTEIWRLGEGRAAFRCSVVERQVAVLSNGLFEYVEPRSTHGASA